MFEQKKRSLGQILKMAFLPCTHIPVPPLPLACPVHAIPSAPPILPEHPVAAPNQNCDTSNANTDTIRPPHLPLMLPISPVQNGNDVNTNTNFYLVVVEFRGCTWVFPTEHNLRTVKKTHF